MSGSDDRTLSGRCMGTSHHQRPLRQLTTMRRPTPSLRTGPRRTTTMMMTDEDYFTVHVQPGAQHGAHMI